MRKTGYRLLDCLADVGRPGGGSGVRRLCGIDRRTHRLAIMTLSSAPVAQMDRAPVYETVGRRFESCRARHHRLSPTYLTGGPDHVSSQLSLRNRIQHIVAGDRAVFNLPMRKPRPLRRPPGMLFLPTKDVIPPGSGGRVPSPCRKAVPVFLRLPHFQYCDPKYASASMC